MFGYRIIIANSPIADVGKLKEAFPVARNDMIYSDELKEKVLRDVTTLGIHQAAREAGIPWQTVTRWVKGESYGKPIRKTGPQTGAKRGTGARKASAAKAGKAPASKRKSAESSAQLIIQSPFGHEISPEDILAKCSEADTVYVRVDQNRLYLVRGRKTSWVDIWPKEETD